MKADELRADAARREKLAKACCDYYAEVRRTGFASVTDTRPTAHAIANDPPAVLAQVARDRLLADCIDALAEAQGLVEFDGGSLLARFSALGLSLLLAVGCADADCHERIEPAWEFAGNVGALCREVARLRAKLGRVREACKLDTVHCDWCRCDARNSCTCGTKEANDTRAEIAAILGEP